MPNNAMVVGHLVPSAADSSSSDVSNPELSELECVVSSRVFTVCANLANEQTHATGAGAYADGFRAAAYRIARQITQLQKNQPPTPLERDLRDAEVEARTLARVVDAAERMLDDVGEESEGADALRLLLAGFFSRGDLPRRLRFDSFDEPEPLCSRAAAAAVKTFGLRSQ